VVQFKKDSYQGIVSEAAEKVLDRAKSGPQALKRRFIFNGLTARVELVPFPFAMNSEFFRNLLGVIIKKGWHHQPWERRASIYLQQSVYTTAFVVAYVRPFTTRRAQFPQDLIVFNLHEMELHELVRSF
jgi:hypothetical protein